VIDLYGFSLYVMLEINIHICGDKAKSIYLGSADLWPIMTLNNKYRAGNTFRFSAPFNFIFSFSY